MLFKSISLTDLCYIVLIKQQSWFATRGRRFKYLIFNSWQTHNTRHLYLFYLVEKAAKFAVIKYCSKYTSIVVVEIIVHC